MDILQRIKLDIEDLKSYFQKLFDAIESSKEYSDSSHYKAYAKSDMLCNIYSCLEFWLTTICEYKYSSLNLPLSYKDIKAKNDLACYQKFLEKVAGIDMSDSINDYNNLQNLRAVRNAIIHAGSHTEKEEINNIRGIKLSGTLIIISDEFVFKSLKSAEVYLLSANNHV